MYFKFWKFGTSNSDRRFLLKVNVGGLGEPYSKKIAKALKWIKVQEKKIPLLYSRLEFGANWEAATQTIVFFFQAEDGIRVAME